jgi:hypothetical protein
MTGSIRNSVSYARRFGAEDLAGNYSIITQLTSEHKAEIQLNKLLEYVYIWRQLFP